MMPNARHRPGSPSLHSQGWTLSSLNPTAYGFFQGIRKLMDIDDFSDAFGDAFTPSEEIAKVKY